MFTRAPLSYDNGFACFHDQSHTTDDAWLGTLGPEHWARFVAGHRAGQLHKVDSLVVPTLRRHGIMPGAKILSVGCGMGFDVLQLRQHGYEAIGCDFGGRTRAWLDNGLSTDMAFLADAADMPLEDQSLDAVFTWSAIEHFGCSDGNQIMAPDTWSIRQSIVERIRSVLKPGGICILGTANKRFPLDQYHGAHFYLPPKVRAWAGRHNLGLHYFWDRRDFLLSRPELERLFARFNTMEWLGLSIGLALDKGLDRKEHASLLRKYARFIDAAGLSTSFLSPSLNLVARK